MSAQKTLITVSKYAQILLVPSTVPAMRAMCWQTMDTPVQWLVEVTSLEAVAVSRLQDGQTATHKKISSANGSLILQTAMQELSSPLMIQLMVSMGWLLVLLTTFSFLMALPAILFLFTNFVSLTILVPLIPQHLKQEWCLLALSDQIVQPAVLVLESHMLQRKQKVSCSELDDIKTIYFFSLVVNECNTDNGGCQQICTDTVSSFECSCREGYELDQDGRSCNGL